MQMSLWGVLMGGMNLLLHGAGWHEGGPTASAEKFIIDVEVLQMFAELFKPSPVSEDDPAVDAIVEVGHGGHFFGAGHTPARYESAFYSPLLSASSKFDNWRDRGSLDATRRANSIYLDTLENFEMPKLEPERLEAIDAFIARRISEGGADILR